MPFGRSDAGLECLSDVVQGLRTFWRAHDVVSTIICWCCHPSDVGGDFGVKQGEFFAGQLRLPAHEPSRIPVPSRAAVVLPSPSEFSPSYGSLGTCAGAPSLSPVAAGNQVLALVCPPLFASRTGRRLARTPCFAAEAARGHPESVTVAARSRADAPDGGLIGVVVQFGVDRTCILVQGHDLYDKRNLRL